MLLFYQIPMQFYDTSTKVDRFIDQYILFH